MANSLQASTAGLAIVDRARLRCGWTKTNTARWWHDAHTSKATLRRFWQQERIQQEIFIALCAAVGIGDWQAIAQAPEIPEPAAESTPCIPSPVLNLDEAPDVEQFYGRQSELAQLQQWVQDGCKLVTILGLGGIGKTALVLALLDPVISSPASAAPFEFVLWRSLQTASQLQTLLDQLLYCFVGPTQDITPDVNQATTQLLGFLRQHRCLLVLDGFDRLFHQAPDLASNYQQFLQRLSHDRHQSCILVTSRQPCLDLANHRTLTLKGLPEPDGLTLLQNQGMAGKDQELRVLLRLYGGNPLALKLIAPLVQTWFGGTVADYLQQDALLLGDRLRTLMRQQLDHLSPLEREIVDWLAIWQEPVSLCRLQSHLLHPPGLGAILDSIVSLGGRSLLENHFSDNAISRQELRLALPPLVMQAVREDLVATATQEIHQAIHSQEIQHFRLLRTHCLCRPGSDDLAGDRLLIQIAESLRSTLEDDRAWFALLALLKGRSTMFLGYATHNLLMLSRSHQPNWGE
jgi:NACHT domain